MNMIFQSGKETFSWKSNVNMIMMQDLAEFYIIMVNKQQVTNDGLDSIYTFDI